MTLKKQISIVEHNIQEIRKTNFSRLDSTFKMQGDAIINRFTIVVAENGRIESINMNKDTSIKERNTVYMQLQTSQTDGKETLVIISPPSDIENWGMFEESIREYNNKKQD